MSLGDALRLLRAQHGGMTPQDIEGALPDLPKGLYRQMEQRYRAMGDDESIRLLAGYFDVPFEELRSQLDWPRKALSRALAYARRTDSPISLRLVSSESVSGKVGWWDLGAVNLVTDAGEVVVQRHAVRQWEPRAPEEAAGADEDREQEE